MKSKLAEIALAAFGLAIITLFLSCADNSDLEFPSKEEMRNKYSSSSVAESSSSSSETEVSLSSAESNSSQTTISSFSFGESSSSLEPVSSSSSMQSSSSAPEECAGIIFNPANKFCYDSNLYDRCGGKEYIPASHICVDGVATPAKCGGESYNPLTQFCSGTTTYGKCGGTVEYNPATESCCGNTKYTLASQFCSGTTIYDKCGDSDYNPATHFCTRSVNNPQIVELCGGKGYDTKTKFCSGTTIYGKCGGTEYNPAIEGCCGSNKYIHESHFCYNNSKIVNFCGINPQTYNPDLYECKSNSNGIYLKTSVSYEEESYEAVLIGTQTWMAKNLNYNADGSKCYNDNEAYCTDYGRLYDWATAMALESSCNSSSCSSQISAKHKGVCPSGWHIPSRAEWDALMTAVGGSSTAGTKLNSASGWNDYKNGGSRNGEDTYGFSALPGGCAGSDGSFGYVGNFGGWWNASEFNNYNDYNFNVCGEGNGYYAYLRFMSLEWWGGEECKSNLFSVRCVQD